MKLRNDFISNSSSSSFIVSDFKKAHQLLNELGTIPWDLDEHFRVNYKVKHKDYKVVYEYLTGQRYSEPRYDYWSPECKYVPPKPDEEEWIWCEGLSPFIDKVNGDKDHILDKVENVELVLDENYHSYGLAILSMLFELFKNEGLNVDSNSSEIPFNDKNTDNFIINLVSSLMNSKGK